MCVYTHINIWDFTGGLDGKESACKVGDLDLIPGGQEDPLEKECYPFQYSCL